jgi:hypothetical protein
MSCKYLLKSHQKYLRNKLYQKDFFKLFFSQYGNDLEKYYKNKIRFDFYFHQHNQF